MEMTMPCIFATVSVLVMSEGEGDDGDGDGESEGTPPKYMRDVREGGGGPWIGAARSSPRRMQNAKATLQLGVLRRGFVHTKRVSPRARAIART